MRITNLTVNMSAIYDLERIAPALKAAFSPFGSLTEGVDGTALAEAMIRWVDAKTNEQPEMAKGLIDLVWSSRTDQLATVEFGSWEVSLRTPTSGTCICLQRYAGGYSVSVDFGAEGSEERARAILSTAEIEGVIFGAYVGQQRIERDVILTSLR